MKIRSYKLNQIFYSEINERIADAVAIRPDPDRDALFVVRWVRDPEGTQSRCCFQFRKVGDIKTEELLLFPDSSTPPKTKDLEIGMLLVGDGREAYLLLRLG